MIAIAIIGILATISFTYLGRQTPEYRRNNFVARLNAMLRIATQNALATNRIHQVNFDFTRHTISVLVDQETTGKKGERAYKLMEAPYANTAYEYDDTLETRNFYIGKEDEFGTGKKEEAWFFIMPEGLAQDVIINMRDTNDTQMHKAGAPLGLVMNPFTVQFDAYDTFAKP